MDAHALLTSQGWRGKGHSLHPTSDTTGLSRPLLVSQKQNNLGVGKKQHKTSDMWWMNAFDKSLQGLDTSEQGKVVQTITSGGLDMVVKGGGKWVGSSGGLYASFVRGEGLGGTITPDTTEGSGSEEVLGMKRRREEGAESKEERRKRKATKRAARIQSTSELTPDSETGLASKEEKRSKGAAEDVSKTHVAVETKEARKARRAAEKGTKAEGNAVETKDERKPRKAAEKTLKPEGALVEEQADHMDVDESPAKPEAKDERKARRAAEKASKSKESAVEDEVEKMEVDERPGDIETKEERRERKRQKKLMKGISQKVSEDTVSSKPKKNRGKD